jgi:hypothetical protein
MERPNGCRAGVDSTGAGRSAGGVRHWQGRIEYGYAARKLDQYAVRKVIHRKSVHSTTTDR